MFFDDWFGLLRFLVVGTLAYAALIVLLRLSGKRSLSKMNAFDLVVAVALGSTFAAAILDNSIPLAEGVLALVLLVCLQFIITWLSVRFRVVENLVKSEPTLLVRDGVYLDEAMRAQRVTRDEVQAAMRDSGTADLSQIACVVLETDGSLSVIQRGEASSGKAASVGSSPSRA
ncbi:MAG TPA: YetF domain-containing protein [Methyloceanibacter sp.]|nr:YetF domain-containing protein [Methyloceanibacter sp.]